MFIGNNNTTLRPLLSASTTLMMPGAPLAPVTKSPTGRPTSDCLVCNINAQQQTIFGTIFSLIIFAGLSGNIFVFCVIIRSKKMMKAPINCLLLNLACADFGNLLAIIPDIILALMDKGWLLPRFFCPLIRYLEEMFLYASLLLQVLICIERYLAICKPFRMKLTKKQAMVLSVMSWLIAITVSLPYGVFMHALDYRRTNTLLCFWNQAVFKPWHQTVFKIFECMFLYVVPLILFTTLYTRTAASLWGDDNVRQMHGSEQMADYILKLRRSVIKMLIICLAIYFFCYSPIQTLFLCENLLQIRVTIPMWMRWTLNALTLANSAANPTVYILCCRQFREKFHCIMRKVPVIEKLVPERTMVVDTLKAPVRAHTAIRTHLLSAMRMANPEMHSMRGSSVGNSSVGPADQASGEYKVHSSLEPTFGANQTGNRLLAPPAAGAVAPRRATLMTLAKETQRRRQQAYDEAVAEL